MTSERPDPLNQSKAWVLMSQPLRSSPASMLSRRYTAWAVGPPLRNSILTLRPMLCDGTSRYSIGNAGLENAPAVAVLPARSINPGTSAVANAAIANRFTQPLDFPPMNAMAAPSPQAPTPISGRYAQHKHHQSLFGHGWQLL